MEVSIRNAVTADAAAVAAIEKACFSAPWSERQIEEEIGKENALFFVAEEDGTVCGYVSAEDISGECYMNNLAVGLSFRGHGIGRQLLGRLIDAVRARRCEFLTLEVRESNDPARHIYETSGFSPAGVRKNFYHAPQENACIYTLYFKEEQP